jgi:uncharacterized protein YegP (UPF0339 family)
MDDQAIVKEIEVRRAENGEWFWRAQAGNNRIIATAGETYQDKGHAVNMASALFPGAPIVFPED